MVRALLAAAGAKPAAVLTAPGGPNRALREDGKPLVPLAESLAAVVSQHSRPAVVGDLPSPWPQLVLGRWFQQLLGPSAEVMGRS